MIYGLYKHVHTHNPNAEQPAWDILDPLVLPSMLLILREKENDDYLYTQNSNMSQMLLFFATNPVVLHLPIVKFETIFMTGWRAIVSS